MIADPPSPPREGDGLRVDWGRRLVAAVRASRPVAGPGLLGRETPNGVVLSLARPASPRGGGGGGGGIGGALEPWVCESVGRIAGDPSAFRIRARGVRDGRLADEWVDGRFLSLEPSDVNGLPAGTLFIGFNIAEVGALELEVDK